MDNFGEQSKSAIQKIQEEIDDAFSLLPSKYIRQDEKDKIKYTKEGIIEFIYNLNLLEYTNKFDQDGIKISTRDYTELSKDAVLYRCEVELNKKSFKNEIPTIKELTNSFINPQKKQKWDESYKEYIILEKINEKTDIIKMIQSRQFNLIPEKEYVDKRISFMDEGIFYIFLSSVPDDLYPTSGDRIINYLEILVIKEDKDNFYFDFFNQIDIKKDIPQSILLMNLPMNIKGFFDKLISYFN